MARNSKTLSRTINCSGVIALICAIAFAMPGIASAQFDLEAMTAGDIDSTPTVVNTFLDIEGSDVRWQKTVTHVGSKYMRLHFTDIVNPDSEAFTLVIKDGDGKIAHEYSHDSLPASDFWTPVIFSSRVMLQLRAESKPASLSFKLSDVAFQSDGGGWLSVIGDDEREPIINYVKDPDIWQVSQPVAKLSFFDDGFFVCTGFMVSPNKMMTNHHCVATAKACSTTVAIFGFHKNASGALVSGEQVACKSVLKADFDKDYAILELADRAGDRWGTLTLDDTIPADDAEIYIIQHPAGEAKQISKINCSVDGAIVDGRASGTDLAHVCDTLGGSSGSPVFSNDDTVIGLHHFGVGQATFWNKNRAVRMKLILSEIAPLL